MQVILFDVLLMSQIIQIILYSNNSFYMINNYYGFVLYK